MIIKLKKGDEFIEVDTEFSDDMIETSDSNLDFENTLELNLDEIVGGIDGNR